MIEYVVKIDGSPAHYNLLKHDADAVAAVFRKRLTDKHEKVTVNKVCYGCRRDLNDEATHSDSCDQCESKKEKLKTMNKDTRRGQLAKRLRSSVYPNRPEWESLSHDTKIEWERMAEEFKRIAAEDLLEQKKIHAGNTGIKIGLEVSIKTIKDL